MKSKRGIGDYILKTNTKAGNSSRSKNKKKDRFPFKCWEMIFCYTMKKGNTKVHCKQLVRGQTFYSKVVVVIINIVITVLLIIVVIMCAAKWAPPWLSLSLVSRVNSIDIPPSQLLIPTGIISVCLSLPFLPFIFHVVLMAAFAYLLIVWSKNNVYTFLIVAYNLLLSLAK